MARIESIDSLVGVHPDALRDYFLAGAPTDSTSLAGERRGLILAIESFAEAFVLLRPLVRALGGRGVFWQGKVFESGGTAGADRILGNPAMRFRCEVEGSLLDDEPALVLHYDGLENGWPWSLMRCELRDVASGAALGPVFFETAAGPRLVLWWGLETRGS